MILIQILGCQCTAKNVERRAYESFLLDWLDVGRTFPSTPKVPEQLLIAGKD
jgi:hypothetical protein